MLSDISNGEISLTDTVGSIGHQDRSTDAQDDGYGDCIRPRNQDDRSADKRKGPGRRCRSDRQSFGENHQVGTKLWTSEGLRCFRRRCERLMATGRSACSGTDIKCLRPDQICSMSRWRVADEEGSATYSLVTRDRRDQQQESGIPRPLCW